MLIRVLIVDDNYSLCKKIEEALEKDGSFEVVGIAGDGDEALDFLRNTEIDLMLLDIAMLSRDGMGVMEGIMENNLPMPVCAVMSSVDDEKIIQSFLEMGAVYYFVKPLDPDLLARRLRNLFRDFLPESEDDTDSALDRTVQQLLHRIAMPPHIMGYRFLAMAIAMAAANPGIIKHMTTELYPRVAIAFGSTRQRVERAMRHAIEVSWDRARAEDIEALFGCTANRNVDKPANSEFIALMADRVNHTMKG